MGFKNIIYVGSAVKHRNELLNPVGLFILFALPGQMFVSFTRAGTTNRRSFIHQKIFPLLMISFLKATFMPSSSSFYFLRAISQ